MIYKSSVNDSKCIVLFCNQKVSGDWLEMN